MNISVHLEPSPGAPPPVQYRWDPDTDILSATVDGAAAGDGLSGTVELMGADGSWVNLDVARGSIRGIEIAVWPDVRRVAALTPPSEIESVRVVIPSRNASPVASVEVETPLAAEADAAERTIHFRVGPVRQTRTVRLAHDVLLDIDGRGRIAGLWLLNVPPLPGVQ